MLMLFFIDMSPICRVILSVRDSCVDWMDGMEPEADPAIKGKKDPESGFPIRVPRKGVSPSATQVKDS